MPQLKWFVPFLLILILLAVVIWGWAPDPPSESPAAAVNNTPSDVSIEQGRLDFAVYCEACHGPNAQGLPGLGPNLTTSEFVHGHTNDALVDFVIQGRPANDPTNQSGVAMPARAGFPRLGADAIRSIITYIRSISTEMSS